MNIMKRVVPILSALLYAAITLWFMLVMNKEMVEEIGCMTPFYCNGTFVRSVLSGNAMGWAALPVMWLCSLMIKPVVGALAMTAIGLLIGWLFYWAFMRKWQLAPIAWSLPLQAQAYFFGMLFGDGYSLYTYKGLATGSAFFFIIILVLIVLPFAVRAVAKKQEAKLKKQKLWLAFVAGLIMMGYYAFNLYSISPTDKNFRDILAMKHAVDRGDWQKVLDVMKDKEPDREPTRVQVTYTRLALTKMKRAGEDTYAYPDGGADYATASPNQYLRLIAGHQLYYHYGKLNFAYRWCMEDMVEYGMRPHYIAYMLRCARLNGEEKLAKKYAKLLSEHPLAKMCKGSYPFSVIDEPADEQVKQMMNYGNVLDGDGGHVEAYLLQSFATMRGGTRDMARTALDCCLVLKDIRDFWAHFGRMMPVWMHEEGGYIPRHYQEAVLLFAQLQGNVDISTVPIDANVRSRFERLVEQSAANSQYGDDYNAQALRPAFGDTYWYYYFFTKDLKTN